MKRKFKQLSIEELARKTGLKHLKTIVFRSIIDGNNSVLPEKDQPAQIKDRAGIILSWKTILLIVLLFTIVIAIVYSPCFHGDFVFDDTHAIQENPLIHITKFSQLQDILFSNEKSRRIGFISFALNYYFGGLNTFGYHLVNIIIHILNGLILFLLSYTILTLPSNERRDSSNAMKISFLGSLLWLVHPIQSQAVSYIVQRLTSLATLFFILSLFCYIKGRIIQDRKRLVFFSLSLIFGLLALGTKQNAATLPVFIILIESFFFQVKPFKIDRKKLVMAISLVGLLILISGIYLGSDFISRISLRYEMRGWTPVERVLTQLRVIIFYVSLLIYPHPSRLNLDHDFVISHSLFVPFTTFLSLLVIISLITLAIFLIKRNRFISYAIFWFFGNLVIESSIIPLEMVFEHRLYLPSMALIILMIALCFSVTKSGMKKWATCFIILLILLLSYWTYERVFVWQGPRPLWLDAVKKSPNKARPNYNLGEVYHNQGSLDKAVLHYKKAITIDPNHRMAHNNLGLVYYNQGSLDEAISELEKAFAINPNFADVNRNLGMIYLTQGSLDKAVLHYKKAIAINPNSEKAHSNLGTAYANQGSLDRAILEYKKAIAINPSYAKAQINLGVAYANQGKLDEAITQYKKALVINPNNAEVHNYLSHVYYSNKNYKLAIIHFDKSVALGFNVDLALSESLKPYR